MVGFLCIKPLEVSLSLLTKCLAKGNVATAAELEFGPTQSSKFYSLVGQSRLLNNDHF